MYWWWWWGHLTLCWSQDTAPPFPSSQGFSFTAPGPGAGCGWWGKRVGRGQLRPSCVSTTPASRALQPVTLLQYIIIRIQETYHTGWGTHDTLDLRLRLNFYVHIWFGLIQVNLRMAPRHLSYYPLLFLNFNCSCINGSSWIQDIFFAHVKELFVSQDIDLSWGREAPAPVLLKWL